MMFALSKNSRWAASQPFHKLSTSNANVNLCNINMDLNHIDITYILKIQCNS